MTRDKLYYYEETPSYTKEEKMQIVKRFVSRKFERYILPKLTEFLEKALIIECIIAVIAIYQSDIALKESREHLEAVRNEITYTSSYEDTLSVEERIWKMVDSIEVQQKLLTNNYTTEDIGKVEEVAVNYEPSEEEKDFAYRLAFGEAGIESELGQILVINVAINNMRSKGYSNLIEEFTVKSRYSSVKDGEVYNQGKIVLTENVPQSIKDAVDKAFQTDYSEQMLKEQAEALGITDSKYWEGGALYFYNPEKSSEYQNSIRENVKIKFRCGNHLFYRYWDK